MKQDEFCSVLFLSHHWHQTYSPTSDLLIACPRPNVRRSSVGHRSAPRLYDLSNANPAGLSRNTQRKIAYHTQYNDPNRTLEDLAWSSELVDPATFIVALDDSYTEERDVLHSMRWPWDSKKGVYTLNSAHELHCLV